MIDTKELRRLAQGALTGPDGVSLNWVKLLQDFQKEASPAAVSELLDSLEAAEKDISLKERIIDSLGLGLNAAANERAASNNDRKITPLERRCYLMSETHLSGCRLIIGFESLEDCNKAHDFLIHHYPKLKTPEAKP